MSKRSIVIGITGASGAIYAQVLLQKILLCREQFQHVGIVLSDNAKTVWDHELATDEIEKFPFTYFEKNDFNAPFASGSSSYDAMIICPCSMGTLSRIAQGISNDLMTRAADVMLKERRKLVLLTRETPLSLIHINNMKAVTEAGGIICPACPSFYSKPKTFEQLAATVVDRALSLCGIEVPSFRWNEKAD